MPDKRSEKRPEKRSTQNRPSSSSRTSKSTTNPVPLKSALAHNSSSKPPLREKKSKTASLFSLFSRPQKERAKGYSEPLPPVRETAALPPPDIGRERPSTRQSVRSNRSGIASRLSFTSRADSPPPNNLKRPASRVSLALGNKSSSQPSSKSRKRKDAPWDPPPLFQAYPQALRHTSLRAPNTNQDSGPSRSESRMSRPGSVLGRSKSRQSNRDGATSRAGMQEGWSKKTYILVTSGHLLEYHGEGAYDRLPEKVLKLGMDSAAFASDLLPGHPYVLQVLQTAGNGVQVVQLPHKSLLSRLGLKSASSRRNVTNLLMIFEDAEVMDTWMIAIRKEIEALGGKRSRPESTMLGYGSPAIVPQSTASRYESMQRSELQRSESRQSNNTVRPAQVQSPASRYDSMQSNSSRHSDIPVPQTASRYDSMRSTSSRQSNHTTNSIEPPTIVMRYDAMQRSSSRQSNHTMRSVRNIPSMSTLHEAAPSPTISKFRNVPEVPQIPHDYPSRPPTEQSYVDDESETDDTASENSRTYSRATSRAESHAMSEDWFDDLPGGAKAPPPLFINGTPRRSSETRSSATAPFMGLSQRHTKQSTSTLGPKPRLSNFSRPHYAVPQESGLAQNVSHVASQARPDTSNTYAIRERAQPNASFENNRAGLGIQSNTNSTSSNHSYLSGSTMSSTSTNPSTRTSAMTLPSLDTKSRWSNNTQSRISPDSVSSDSSATPTTEGRRKFRSNGPNLVPLQTAQPQYQSKWSQSPISPVSPNLPFSTPDTSLRHGTPSPVNGYGNVNGKHLRRSDGLPASGSTNQYMPSERASIVVPIVRPPSIRKDRRPSGDVLGRRASANRDAVGGSEEREREWEEKRMSANLPPMMPPPTSPLPKRPRGMA